VVKLLIQVGLGNLTVPPGTLAMHGLEEHRVNVYITIIIILVVTMKGLGAGYFSYLRNHWACRALVKFSCYGI